MKHQCKSSRCTEPNLALLALITGVFLPIGCTQRTPPVANNVGIKTNQNANRSATNKAQRDESHASLAAAIGTNDLTQVQKLVKDNPQLIHTQGRIGTPLHVAVSKSTNPEIVKFLLDSGADVNARDKRGNAPLNVAVRGRNSDTKSKLVALLLSRGADVNAKTQPAQNTALHVASLNGDVPVVKILLSHKADVNATDSQGRTALGNVLGLQKQYKAGDSNTRRMSKFMDMERYPDVIQLLQKAGARTK
jgi:hypothetical protein